MTIMKKYIDNWDKLTDEQKKEAEKQFVGNPGLNTNVVHPAAKFFEEHRWVKIDKFIDINMCNLLYHYTQLEAQRLSYFEDNAIEIEDKCLHGTFKDTQAPGDFSKYGDPTFDTLLSLSLAKMEELTARELVPTYSYHRLYTTGTELEKHSDRPSCEISTTICLGYDVSNVDAKTYPDWSWPMYIKEKNGEEIPVDMKPGDMIIYRGCELEHWREPFWGKNHAQAFLHYNEKYGKYGIPFDGRPVLGMSDKFRSKDVRNIKVDEKDIEHRTQEVYKNNKKVIY